MSNRRIAVVGLGVVAISVFGATAPAAAAEASRTALTSSTPSVGIGGTAKLKAVVKPVNPATTLLPQGTVTFKEGATTIGAPVTLALVGTVQTAKIEIANITAGNHTYTATYNGNADFTTSTSTFLTISVGKANTTTTASSSTPAPAPGQDVKLKAVVKPASGTVKPTGNVVFSEGATTYGTVALVLVGTVETAKLTILGAGLALGNHTFTATYQGTATFNGSAGTIAVTVAKGNSTTTLTPTPDVAGSGQTTLVILVKAVAPAKGVPSGLVNVVVDNGAIQQFALSGTGRASLGVTLLPSGSSHTARVSYLGDALFNASNSGTITFVSP